MIKILMVCHGNICRSTMAEFVFKDMIQKQNLDQQFHIASAGTSNEEIGNPVYPGTRNKLAEHGISTEGKYAVQLTEADYQKYDYILGMDKQNMRNMARIFKGDPEQKVKLLLEYVGEEADIADPWYTRNFDITYDDVYRGCTALLAHIMKEHNL
jgi:Protein-tyrosine-phosphatase